MSRKRSINRAQAIHPYGVGAILDWGQECFVMMDTSGGGWVNRNEINLARLERQLGVKGFRVPPVSDGQGAPKLPIDRFPRWLFCPSCRRMKRWTRDDEVALKGDALPTCSDRKCGGAILVPMRYVAACEDGHMADVDWFKWAHAKKGKESGACDPEAADLYFDADTTKGMSLNALRIRCGSCEARNSLEDIQKSGALRSAGQHCKGRQPWEPGRVFSPCKKPLQALLRSQTAVHFSSVVSAIDLSVEKKRTDEDFEYEIKKMVDSQRDIHDLDSLDQFLEADLLARIARALSRKLGREVDEGDVAEWVGEYLGPVEDDEAFGDRDQFEIYNDLLDEEWPILTTPTTDRSKRANLIVTRTDFPGDDEELGRLFDDVLLIERLREVRAFTGFKRVSTKGNQISPHLAKNEADNRQRDWLPATEVFGEGIFFVLSNEAVREWEKRHEQSLSRHYEIALKALDGGEGYRGFLYHAPILPRSILLHTLSHVLMRQLCYECGYHAASIRERLYVTGDRLGFLIYTADGDSEGSLGGLVRQGETARITKTLRSALERAAWCSNDPICSELPEHGVDRLNKAACHACSLVPETSCTHLNSMLDRRLLVETSEASSIRGFFADIVE